MGLRRGVCKLSLNAPMCGRLGPELGGREKDQERDVGRDVGKDDARNYTRCACRIQLLSSSSAALASVTQ